LIFEKDLEVDIVFCLCCCCKKNTPRSGVFTNRKIKLYYTSAIVQVVAGENTQQRQAEIPTWAKKVEIPDNIQEILKLTKKSQLIENSYNELKSFLTEKM
jgi:hypothetical protein